MNPETGEIREIPDGETPPPGWVSFAKGQQVRIHGCVFVVEDVDASTRQLLLTQIPRHRADQNRRERRSKMADLRRKMRRARKALVGAAPDPSPA